MIQKTSLKGIDFKKYMGAFQGSQRWHNKNKNGGNFGINVYFGKEFVRGRDSELTGDYNKDGEIVSLSWGRLYSCGHRVPVWALESKDILFDYLIDYTIWEYGCGESPKIRESELLTREEQFIKIG